MERALIMLKPDGVALELEAVVRERLSVVGLTVTCVRYGHLTEDKILRLHPGHDQREHWPSYLEFMTSGPICLIVCEGENANAKVTELKGTARPKPHGLRGEYASSRLHNVLHTTENSEEAEAEFKIFAEELG